MTKDDLGEEILVKKKSVSGIQALISKLRGEGSSGSGSGSGDSLLGEDETFLNPVLLDAYCNHGQETALHCAVRRREGAIAAKLLAAGANPNLAIYSPVGGGASGREGSESAGDALEKQFSFFKGSTCLVEACRNK